MLELLTDTVGVGDKTIESYGYFTDALIATYYE